MDAHLLEHRLEVVLDGVGRDEGAFVPPDAIDDFTLRLVALLDGLALQRLRRLHQLSRKRVIELAMKAARAELAPGSQNAEP
jgi:hypothetical protein